MVPFVSRGWWPHDEGLLGQSADAVLRGGVPHIDYEESYSGGLSWLYAGVFKVAGVELLNIRWFLFFGASWAGVPHIQHFAALSRARRSGLRHLGRHHVELPKLLRWPAVVVAANLCAPLSVGDDSPRRNGPMAVSFCRGLRRGFSHCHQADGRTSWSLSCQRCCTMPVSPLRGPYLASPPLSGCLDGEPRPR